MKVLLAGGLGYIGSHTAVEMANAGHEVIIVDDLSNSKIKVIKKLAKIIGKEPKFYKLDICNEKKLDRVFEENPDIFAVVHFAGHKIVNESIAEPLKYYQNNLISTFSLLKVMKKYGCKNIIFSSSANVYAPENSMPLTESSELRTTSPYGRTKFFNEFILRDFQYANKDFNVVLLRYFNPIGAHDSGLIGEDPYDVPTNLMPYICKVAVGELDHLSIFGGDYDTKDGTGIRDYIHVVDLAIGHVKALEKIIKEKHIGTKVYNLGTGTGYSVLEVVNTFMKVNNVKVKYKIVGRREGDLPVSYTSAKLAEKELGFKAQRTLDDMCRSSYNYQVNNRKKK